MLKFMFLIALFSHWIACLWGLIALIEAKTFGDALGTTVNWIANWFIARTFPPLLEASGPALAYGLYATAAAISFFLVIFFVRETRGKELEDMA